MQANELTLRLDWSEMDLFGHINNVAYFKYLQSSRVHLWESLHMHEYHRMHGIGPALAKTECSFMKPLFYPGKIRIEVLVGWIKTTSFQLKHTIYNERNEICATGEDIIVIFDYTKGKKAPLPPEFAEELKRYTSP